MIFCLDRSGIVSLRGPTASPLPLAPFHVGPAKLSFPTRLGVRIA